MKIAVYGAGGVGGYYGGRLAQVGAEVHLIARGAHLRALKEQGLRIRSPQGDFELRLPVAESPEEIGPSDYVLFCVKSFDTEKAATHLQPLLEAGTAVISLQNGVDNEGKIAAAVGTQHVMGGASFIMSTISEPGVIEHIGELSRIVFGELDGERSERAELFLSLCREAGIDAELSPNIRSVLWNKFAFICAFAGMTAAVRLPLGEVRADEHAMELARGIMEEVVAVGRAQGVDLAEDTVDGLLRLAMQLDPESYSSLHYDLTHGKPMELEALQGTAVRLARKHGLAAPNCEAIYAILKPWAVRNEAHR
jgi:2-dehydropantoate 2-reductase